MVADMILRICSVCGKGLGVKDGSGPDGKDAVSHGLCGCCEAMTMAEQDVNADSNDGIIAVQSIIRAYHWRATANVLKADGWTFPPGTFIGED